MQRRERVQQSVSYEYNGVKYSRLDDMPPDVREHFVDRDGNGLPDAVDRLMKEVPAGGSKVIKTERRSTRVLDLSGSRSSSSDLNVERLFDRDPPLDTVHCSGCGYDLQGSPVGGKCPECGQSVIRSVRRLAAAKPRPSFTVSGRAIAIALILAAVACAALIVIQALRSIGF